MIRALGCSVRAAISFGTMLGNEQAATTPTTMKTRTNRVERLKKQARRLMLAGDVSRYMSKLRELYETRSSGNGLAIG